MPAAFGVLLFVGIAHAGVYPSVMAELNNRRPGLAGSATAVMAMGAAVGAAIFPWMLGVLAEHVSLSVGFAVPVALQLGYVITFRRATKAAG